MNNEIKINVPEGMEIDKENSTFECIKFKPKWVPKRGDFAAVGNDHSQIILVAEYINPDITGFDIKPLALLSENGLSLYNDDSYVPTLWVSEEASASEKKLFIEKLNEQGYIYDPNDSRVIYKKEKELPKTWKEFCNNYPVKPNEAWIDSRSNIELNNGNCERDYYIDANNLPSKEYAEAMLALCKLIQLRDCYNDGWKPNWSNNEGKAVIRSFYNTFQTSVSFNYSYILSFKTTDLRDIFLHNFRNLIEQAKPLL